jgi:hypothetical protein
MIGFLLTVLILFIALNCAFYLGAYARSDDDIAELWHAMCWSWRHEPWNIGLCTFVLLFMAVVFAAVFHLAFVRDVLMS